MTGNNNDGLALPKAMTELEWVWVLSTPITKNHDSIFLVEMKEKEGGQIRRIVPVFEAREDADQIKGQLCQDKDKLYTPQAARLSEVGKFAAQNEAEIMLLDAKGTIMAHMEAKIEQVAVH